MQSATDLVFRVLAALTDDLRRPPWRGNQNPLVGHCYVSAEALFHMLGGKAAGWKPMFVRHEGAPHWFLKHESGRVLDASAAQFKSAVRYDRARGKGFLTAHPSARTRIVLERAGFAELARARP